MSHNISKLIDRAKDEVLWILIAYFSFYNGPDLSNVNRYVLVSTLIMSKCLIRDIVLRLTRLDDKNSGSKIFREVLKRGGQSSKYSQEVKNWSQKISNYRDKIQHLKNERNKFIAHLDNNSESRYRIENIPIEIKECIIEAIDVVDAFQGIEVEYNLSVGSLEEDVNLRKYILQN